MGKEKSDEHMVSLEKLSILETVCLLGKRKPDTKVKIGIDMDDYYRIRDIRFDLCNRKKKARILG